jgi:hypothetical protein
MRDASSNPKATPVSFVFDGYGNRVDRYESDGTIRLTVTRSIRSPRTEQQVIEWYWQHVGASEWQEDHEHPTNSLYRPEPLPRH